MASVNQSPEVKSILKQTPDLTTALSNDSLGVAGILLSKELICEEVYSEMLIDSYTPAKKAAILVRAVRNTIEITPVKFQWFLEILSEQQVCAKEVVERLHSTYQSQLDQVDYRGSHESVDIASKIETLEDQFGSLRTRIMLELSAKPDMTVQTLLSNLTGLPLSLRKEYESSIAKRIPSMRTETQVNELFIIHLNPLTSFIDYGLIEYVIKKFGSDGLRKDMRSYCSEMVVFMREATIKQLIETDHFLGQTEIPPKFSFIEAKIGEDASKCTLEHLNKIRKRYCSEVKLSDIVCHLVVIVESNSFIVRWLVPSALVEDIMKSTRSVDQSFYQEYKITSLTLDGMWLYVSKSEVDAMWSQVHVSDIKFKDQFHTMCKQVVCEMKVQNMSDDCLSYLQSLNYQQQISDQLSLAILEEEFPASFVDFGVLKAVIERFGSDCLQKVMESYCNCYMSLFTKESTAQQLISIGNMSTIQFTDFKYFKIARCKIMEEPSSYRLDTLLSFRTRFCTTTNFSEVYFIMSEVNTETKNSFTVSWLVSPTFMKSVRNLDQSFFQGYKITSLTLDGMWLYISKSEIDAMWSRLHVSDTKFKEQFHTMYKQIVNELEMAQIMGHKLSSFFEKSLRCQQSTSYLLSHELLNRKLPVSVVDFRVLAAAIEGFGSDCLKSVMSSYSKYVSTFLKKCTAQQLINLSAIQLQPSGYSIVKCRIKDEPSQYKLDKLLSLRTRFCTIANFSELCFVMDEVTTEMSGLFTVSWLVPPAFISGIMKSGRNFDHSLYHRYNITSLILDGMWLFLNKAKIDAMWSQVHVSNTKLKNQFYTMCKQIVYEMKEQNVSEDDLSLHFQSLNYQRQVSDQLSLAVLEEEFPASFVDFGVLKAVIKEFGSDCLKRVMESYYCNYKSIFTKKSTAQQLINLSAFQSGHYKHFVAAKCTIMEEPSHCRIEKLLQFRTRFCAITRFNEVCFIMDEVKMEMSGSFTISWLVPSALVSDVKVKFARYVDQSFYQEYKLASLTLDGMWLFLSEAEIDAMWSKVCVGDTKFNDRFHIMHKQILCEVDRSTATNKLSSYLIDQQPTLQRDVSINISQAFLNSNFPLSLIDFRMLTIVIELFGSDCLKRVMESYCRFMSTFIKQSTLKQVIDLSSIQSRVSENFLTAECKIKGEPLEYGLEELLEFQTKFCSMVNINKVCFVMDKIETETGGSFIIKWHVPTSIALELLKSANQLEQTELFQEMNIFSLRLGGMWMYNFQLTPLGIQLRKRYQQSQGSPSPVEWIPSPTRKIFRLAMIQRERVQRRHIEDRFVQMTISGRVDDILHAKSPVELEHIFSNTLHGGEIILIEGAPGSGKSTLTVHICQRWGKGELFQQFTAVILVQLRDPAVQRAQTIADLLPVENAEEIAAELIATNGRGVLWVLDGWDELPPHLQQDSIFCQLIKRMLSECSVVVTSRPISSGDLHPVVSSRIEVLGFTPEEQRQYFTECLKGDIKALEALLEKIQENPVVQSICYLPLNAAFIVHTFKYRDQSLPNTEYEIYLSVILSCIQRHYVREGRGHDLPRELASLEDLSRSEAVRESFQCLCELAYHGVMENKVTFSSSDLPQGSNTLSLLQAIESFLQNGKSVFYNFLHLSIQEVLSAYYITTELSGSEQVSQFQRLFDQPRSAAVFQFYAAITKLKSPGIRQVIDRVVEAKSKALLVSLLRCLHEAQDPALCLYVAERLEYELNVDNISLSPLDCLSVSFFLSSLGRKKTSTDLHWCGIGDLGAKCLSRYLHADTKFNSDFVSKISIDLANNVINEEGALHIARMIYYFEHLYLSHNSIGDTGTSLISEAVRETATLKTLILDDCGVTSRGAEDLSRALAKNSSLEKLDIGGNNLGDEGISHVAEALKQNKQLKELWISWCGMTDKGAASLASALTVNDSLKILHIGGGDGKLTESGLSMITHSLANKSMFEKLAIPARFGYTTVDRLSQEVIDNKARKRNGLPPIEIEATRLASSYVPSKY